MFEEYINYYMVLQIHAVDKKIASMIVTNQMLHNKSIHTSDEMMSETSSTMDSIAPGHRDINVQFDLSSLMGNSRCLVMMISAFCRKKGKPMAEYTNFK